MSNTVTFTINFDGNAVKNAQELIKVTGNLNGILIKVQGVINNITSKLLQFNQVTQSVQNVATGFRELSESGLKFNTSLSELSALTGVTGGKLKEIEGYARDMAKTFGGSAAQGTEAYKLVLSQLGPEISHAPQALAAMGTSIMTLSKTMGNDATGAAEVLTTAMNQFQVSLEDPTKAAAEMAHMMNVMAAAAKEGSAELPAIKAALEQSGMAAKMAGVSFEETNAAIQVLDKAGKKASEGGVALRNIMATLSQGRFLPQDVILELQSAEVNVDVLTDKSRTLSERLQELSPVLNDTALVTKMFGKENANAATALLSSIDLMDQYTTAVTGTISAEEQAAIVMQSREEQMARYSAKIEDLKISFFNATGSMLPFVEATSKLLLPIAQMLPLFSGVFTVLLKMGTAFKGTAAAIAIKSAAVRVATGVSSMYKIALKKMTIALGSARAATVALGATLSFGLTVAIQAIISLIQRLVEKKREGAQATEELKNEEDEYNNSIITAKSEMAVLTARLSVFNGTKEDETNIVSELNAKYGEIFGCYDTVKEWYDTLIKKSDAYVQQLKLEAKMRILAAKAGESSVKIDDLQKQLSNTPKVTDEADVDYTYVAGEMVALPNGRNKTNTKYTALEKELSAEKSNLLAYEEDMKKILIDIEKIRKQIRDGGSVKKTIQEEEAIKGLDSQFAKIERLSSLFGDGEDLLQQKIKATRSAITNMINSGKVNEAELDVLIKKYRELIILMRQTERGETIQPLSKQKRPEVISNKKVTIDRKKLEIDNNNSNDLSDAQRALERYKQTGAATNEVFGALSSTFSSLSGLLSEQAGAWMEYAGKVLQAAGQVVASIISMIVAQKQKSATDAEGTVIGAMNSTASIPVVGPILAIASMAAMIAAIASIPKFAAGGVVSGPTMALVGEYPGAANNPEVIAPLNKLRAYLEPAGFVGEIAVHISGNDLYGVMKKNQRLKQRTR